MKTKENYNYLKDSNIVIIEYVEEIKNKEEHKYAKKISTIHRGI